VNEMTRFVATSKDNEKVNDWTRDEILELGSKFENAKSKEEAQTLYDKVHSDVSRSFAITKEHNLDQKTSEILDLEESMKNLRSSKTIRIIEKDIQQIK